MSQRLEQRLKEAEKKKKPWLIQNHIVRVQSQPELTVLSSIWNLQVIVQVPLCNFLPQSTPNMSLSSTLAVVV